MNYNIPDDLYQHLKAAKQLASNRLLRPNFFANVTGVGIGQKVVDGVPTETWAIRVYVQSKLDVEDVTPAYMLPTSFLDVPTDIIEVGRFGRAGLVPNGLKPPKTIGPGTPIRIESRASNVNSGAVGTLGALVVDASDNTIYILSCNHILAVNGRVKTDPEAHIVTADGAPIAVPGPFHELTRHGANQVDCALAVSKIDQRVQTTDKPIPPALGMTVTKTGAATGTTNGVIVDIDADLYVDYSFGTFRFINQVVIDGQSAGNPDDIFATDGDSGSIVFTETEPNRLQALAMVFAEAGRFAVACPLIQVFSQLEKEKGSLSLVVE